jgi:predicted ATPase/transcriptional regulator with XRE-family HTH domain
MDAVSGLTRGERVRRLRRDAGLSQEELAARAGISLRSVSNLERDAPHAPRRETLRLVAEALGVSGVERERLLDAAPARPPPPPPRSAVPHNLPASPNPLIGRGSEVATVRRAMRRTGARLVTLLGPGGVGKTRLAVAVAGEARPAFPDGAWFADLTPIADPDLVWATVVQILGLPPPENRPALEVLTDHLRERRTLLLLDNCERMLPAATAVADLLAACPGLTVLATSREPLRLRWEHRIPVPPLSVPDPDAPPDPERLARVASVRLFVERARAATPAFALDAGNAAAVAAICTRLDGLPLAIELAAARVSELPPLAMLARLERSLRVLRWEANDLPARHRTLQAAIDWSHDLLPVAERALFRRLAVFAGGFTPEAAADVGDADALGLDPFAALAALAEKGLVHVLESEEDGPRFGLLETMREYGRERLAADGELDRTRTRHAAHFLALAERADRELTGPGQAAWLERLAGEHDNLRAALRWTLDRPSLDLGPRLASVLARFWYMHGDFSEGRRWLGEALARGGAVAPATRARALRGISVLMCLQGDYGPATEALEESLVLGRQIGDEDGIAASCHNLGTVAMFRADYDRAGPLFEECVRLGRRLGDRPGLARSLGNLGIVERRRGRPERAVPLLEESVALFRALGDRHGTAISLADLGLAALNRGDDGWAAALLEESLALVADADDEEGSTELRTSLGRALLGQRDYRRAIALFRESLPRLVDAGNRDAAAHALQGLAAARAALGDARGAARLFGAAAALREAVGAPLAPADRAAHDRDLAATRAALDEAAFAAAWAAGQALPLDQAVAEALAPTPDEAGPRPAV